MKLTSMTDFVLNQKQSESFNEKTFINEELISLEKIRNYAKFLKQPLKLEMFVPCDEDGDILHEPKDYEQRLPNIMTEYNDEVYRYKQAKEKVLFDGFYWEGNYAVCMAEDEMIYIDDEFMHNMTIDKLLTTIITDLQLTESAIKQIGI